MNVFKRMKWFYIGISIISIILGLLLIIWPTISAITLCYITGIIILISGGIDLTYYFSNDGMNSDFIIGIIKGIFGVILILHPSNAVILFTFVIGIFIIINSILHIKKAIEGRRFNKKWLILLSISILSFIFGMIVLFADKGQNSIMILIGIGLLINGISNIYDYLKFKKNSKINKVETIEVEAKDVD